MNQPNGHPTSCPCSDCNDFDLGEILFRQEARFERWDERVPDSRTLESAGGNEENEPRHRTL